MIVFQVWDFAINAGMATAKRKLQSAVGVADDGIIGPITLNAVNDADLNDVLMKFNAERLTYYKKLSTWGRYGKGWKNRVAGQLQYAAIDN